MATNVTIGIIEDDVGIRGLITDLLAGEGFEPVAFDSAAAFQEARVVERLDCLLLDLMLPGESGLSICRDLRAQYPRLPIIIVTAKGDEFDRVLGLEIGADDYLAKPFSSRELLARVRALLRRTREIDRVVDPAATDTFRFAGWTLVLGSRSLVDPDGEPVELTSGEFDLLLALVTRPQRVLTRDQLLDWTRGRTSTPFDRVIDVQLSRLRKKLGDHPREPTMIKTVRGDGYLFAPPVFRG
jgi:two-component system OmpR family response regulator